MAQNFAEKIVRFKLVDVDGVFLDNAGDAILSREPEGFTDIDITLERDYETHGVFYEFASEDSEFGFDRACNIEGQLYDPYTFLLAVYGRAGIDSNVEIVVTTKDNALASEVIQYTGRLTFSTFRLVDYKISLNSKRVTLSDKFRTRIDTKVNFDATESIDGTPVSGTFPRDTFLHSNLQRYTTDIEFTEYDNNTLEADTTATTSKLYCNVGFSESNPSVGRAGYNDFIQDGIRTFNSSFTTITEVPNPFFVLEEGGKLTINNVKINAEIRHISSGGGDVTIGLYGRSGFNGDDVLIGSLISLTGVSGYVESIVVDESDIEFDIAIPEKGGSTSFYLHIVITETSPNSEIKQIKTPDPFDPFPIEIDVEFDSISNGSTAKTYAPFNSVNHVLEVITDQIDPLESDFLTNELDQMQLTNGYKIRNFEDRNVITDFDSLFKGWLQPMWGLGYTVYSPFSEPDDVFKVKIEPYDFFYQDREVFNIGTIVNDTFEISIDQDLICNEIEVGYRDYPKSTDENTGNNIDEFNTIHDNLTPITTLKAKKQYISGVIGSGYKLESQRREQYKDVPSDTVTDDDNLFCINTIRTDEYEIYGDNTAPIYSIIANSADDTLSLLGTYFDLQEGDEINVDRIGGASAIEGDYTIVLSELKGDRMVLSCDSVPVDSDSTSNYLITRNTLRRRALRNEEFEILTGVISPDTVYNVGLNPKLMMLNHGSLFNSGFIPKPDTDYVSVTEAKLNADMTYKYKVGEGSYNKDTTQTRRMGDNVELQNIDNYNKLFNGLTYSFQSNMSYEDVMVIRSFYLNELDNPDNMGYIQFTDPFGQERVGYLMSMIYNPFRESVEFILRGKFVPDGGAFDYVLDEVIN